MRQKTIIRSIAAAVVLGALAATWWATQGGQASELPTTADNRRDVSGENYLPVDVVELGALEQLEVSRAYAGLVKSVQSSRLGFELAGRVAQVFVEVGDHVVEGQLLATLDYRRWAAQRDQFDGELRTAEAVLKELVAGPRQETLDSAAAQVKQLEAQLDLARIKFDRRSVLRRDSAASQEELDEQRFEVEILQARLDEAQAIWSELDKGTRQEKIDAQRAVVEQLRAAKRQAEIEVGHAFLFAPFDGQIVSRQLEVGDIAAKGVGAFELESDEREIWIGCPPEVAGKLQEGTIYDIRVSTQHVSARLRTIVAKLETKTRTQTLVFDLDGDSDQIPTGVIARLSVTEQLESTGFWVPADSLTAGSHGLWAAFVTHTDPTGVTKLVRRDVEMLHVQDSGKFVRGTLKPGDTIVAAGVHRLVAGQEVEPNLIQWSHSNRP